jgi:hypothetical protein
MGSRSARLAAWVLLASGVGLAGCPSRRVMRPEPDPGVAVPVDGEDDACGPYSADTLMRCASQARIEADVRSLAVARPPGSDGLAKARELCRGRLESLGYEVRLMDYGGGVNVIGDRPGFSKPDERVIVGAHYDQLGGCPGADDNASGVAAVLEAARVLATARFDRTLTVSCWDQGEGEPGQRGSSEHARAAQAAGGRVALALSFEAIGFASREKDSQTVPEGFEQLFPDQALALLDNDFRADFLTVVAETSTEPLALRAVAHGKKNELGVHVLTLTERQKQKQKKLHRSDHASFWEQGMPGLLFTDSGPFRNPRIHCRRGDDDAESLDYDFAARVARTGIAVLADALELR